MHNSTAQDSRLGAANQLQRNALVKFPFFRGLTMQSDSPCVRIVDDDQAIRKLLTILVESWGYSSRAYASAEHFMSEDRLSDPGCVLVDLEMPGASGAELVGWLIQQPDPLPAIEKRGHRIPGKTDRP